MNAKKKILTVSIVLGTAFLLLFLFLIRPLLGQVKESFVEYKNVKQELLQLENRSMAFKNIERNYNKSLRKYIERIDSYFIDSEMPVDFIKFLEKTALSSNVLIEVSPLSSKKDAKDSMNFRIKVKGNNFKNLFSFLERIERSSYLLEVQGLNIRESKEEASLIMPIKVLSKNAI